MRSCFLIIFKWINNELDSHLCGVHDSRYDVSDCGCTSGDYVTVYNRSCPALSAYCSHKPGHAPLRRSRRFPRQWGHIKKAPHRPFYQTPRKHPNIGVFPTRPHQIYPLSPVVRAIISNAIHLVFLVLLRFVWCLEDVTLYWCSRFSVG